MIGWADNLPPAASAAVLAGVLGLVGLAVWHDVRAERRLRLVAVPAAPRRATARKPETDQLAA